MIIMTRAIMHIIMTYLFKIEYDPYTVLMVVTYK